MENEIFQEMHKLGHDDERRYQLLMRGVRKLQEKKKKEQGFLKRVYNSRLRKNKQYAADAWHGSPNNSVNNELTSDKGLQHKKINFVGRFDGQ
ncbi:hypothetical protein [Paenibacillus sp. GCM10027626]|uniref:hypothetical protein n=1 Tax=Paenibacillus sp. GCM10027626 TaxID=3273411 RepID=UPI00363B5109